MKSSLRRHYPDQVLGFDLSLNGTPGRLNVRALPFCCQSSIISNVVQVYFLSEIYLLISAMIFLADRYGMNVIILLNVRSFYLAGRRRQIAFPIIGALLTIGLLFSPIEPCPIVIGDLLPAACVLLCVFNYMLALGSSVQGNYSTKRDRFLGWFALCVGIVHFLFPRIVIL